MKSKNQCKFHLIGLGKFTDTTRMRELAELTNGAPIHAGNVIQISRRKRATRSTLAFSPANPGGAAA